MKITSWILFLSLLTGAVLSHDTPICGGPNDCTCHECNRCFCSEEGSTDWGCTEIGCPWCDHWETRKNVTEDGHATCVCECGDEEPEPETCTVGDCACDECNACTCMGETSGWGQGTWACTEMACIASARDSDHHDDDDGVDVSQYCSWVTLKSYDEHGVPSCECECVTDPDTASGIQAGLLLTLGSLVLATFLG